MTAVNYARSTSSNGYLLGRRTGLTGATSRDVALLLMCRRAVPVKAVRHDHQARLYPPSLNAAPRHKYCPRNFPHKKMGFMYQAARGGVSSKPVRAARGRIYIHFYSPCSCSEL
jgi:hypothetical protein